MAVSFLNFCVFSSFYRQLFPVYALGFAELHSGFSSPSAQLQASGKSHSELLYEKVRTAFLFRR
ncbi:MAG: hypothetical protein Q8P26_01325 [Candidatus Levybacteria bacterium]|nr:hypothetical protein [Candidatus Levybacteria bacterium]